MEKLNKSFVGSREKIEGREDGILSEFCNKLNEKLRGMLAALGVIAVATSCAPMSKQVNITLGEKSYKGNCTEEKNGDIKCNLTDEIKEEQGTIKFDLSDLLKEDKDDGKSTDGSSSEKKK